MCYEFKKKKLGFAAVFYRDELGQEGEYQDQRTPDDGINVGINDGINDVAEKAYRVSFASERQACHLACNDLKNSVTQSSFRIPSTISPSFTTFISSVSKRESLLPCREHKGKLKKVNGFEKEDFLCRERCLCKIECRLG